METDDQQGLAHFLEHMAFNGSTNVPEGEMVKILERAGLAFGADTNASTDFDADHLPARPAQDRRRDGRHRPDAAARGRRRADCIDARRHRPRARRGAVRGARPRHARLPRLRGALPLLPAGPAAGRAACPIGDGRGAEDRQARPLRWPSTTPTTGPSAPPWWWSATSTSTPWRPRSAPASPTGAPPAPTARARAWARSPKRGPEAKVVVEPGGPATVQIAWVSPPDLSADSRGAAQGATGRASSASRC